jgi:hypothetical protein
MWTLHRHSSALIAVSLTILATVTAVDARAEGIIKNPGDHPKYSVELEPHGLIDWDNYWWGSTGFGLGMHAVIPFLDNGPVSTINNNMGIGFGLNWSHFSGNNCGFFYNGRGQPVFNGVACDVSANSLKFPVYVQWNFFFTKVVGVFAEAGFGIYHDWFSPPGGCPVGYSCNDTGAFPYFEGGGRFLFGDTVGLLVRIGYPYLTIGASFLL